MVCDLFLFLLLSGQLGLIFFSSFFFVASFFSPWPEFFFSSFVVTLVFPFRSLLFKNKTV
ncbi:hypothetical protein DFJ73DRAFT_873866 [Zopfochytrium polystomum]|nr:hypothetical protein DFJ73DRAFT_873866 [Zopfochytrium polystomum]